MLPKAILGRKDIIGAAETGSGKTLAYGLPFLSEILTRRDTAAAASDREKNSQSPEDNPAIVSLASEYNTDAGKMKDVSNSGGGAEEGGKKLEGGLGGGEEVEGSRPPRPPPPQQQQQQQQGGLEALVLCPTRELALQVAAHLREVIGGTGLSVVVSGERCSFSCMCELRGVFALLCV